MSQTSIHSQYNRKWQEKKLVTYDCSICLTLKTHQLLELPCGHKLCLSCLHMICAYSQLTCPFCRRRISTWLRRNPDYSKLIIKRGRISRMKKKVHINKQEPKRRRYTSKPKPTIDENGNISEDWLLARKIHYEQIEEFRYTHGRITRSMVKNIASQYN